MCFEKVHFYNIKQSLIASATLKLEGVLTRPLVQPPASMTCSGPTMFTGWTTSITPRSPSSTHRELFLLSILCGTLSSIAPLNAKLKRKKERKKERKRRNIAPYFLLCIQRTHLFRRDSPAQFSFRLSIVKPSAFASSESVLSLNAYHS